MVDMMVPSGSAVAPLASWSLRFGWPDHLRRPWQARAQRDPKSGSGRQGVATFTVWKFEEPDGAERAAELLTSAASDGIVTLIDHAVVSWPVGATRPRTQHGDGRGSSAGWGAFWGLLFGTLFFAPLLGAAAGAGIGALSGSMRDVGITPEQLDTLRWQIREGTSALFALTDRADLAALAERFHGMRWLLIDTNLTEPERGRLLEAFGD
jgi:uncharacterized membrane protein